MNKLFNVVFPAADDEQKNDIVTTVEQLVLGGSDSHRLEKSETVLAVLADELVSALWQHDCCLQAHAGVRVMKIGCNGRITYQLKTEHQKVFMSCLRFLAGKDKIEGRIPPSTARKIARHYFDHPQQRPRSGQSPITVYGLGKDDGKNLHFVPHYRPFFL